MSPPKDLWLIPAALLILFAAAFVVFPLYVHTTVGEVVGTYAPLYLYDYSPYGTITVEVHYQPDAVPSDAALSGLRQMLAEYTGKRVEVQTYEDLPGDIVTERIDDNNIYSVGDGIISKYGKAQMGWLGGNMPIYIIYLNAQGPAPKTAENDTVVGISYRADSFIILREHIDSEELEKSVLIHETGHLLGLEHDENQSCVMTSVMLEKKSWLFGRGGPPAEFCDLHKQELSDRRHDLFYNAKMVMAPGYVG